MREQVSKFGHLADDDRLVRDDAELEQLLVHYLTESVVTLYREQKNGVAGEHRDAVEKRTITSAKIQETININNPPR